MTRHSSVEIDSSQPTKVDVPLSDRPVVAVDQNTVISANLNALAPELPETPLTGTAQEIRDRLFALPDLGDSTEQGVRMGSLEVESRIGAGGMGAVFKAVDMELSRTIALKILHPTIAADPALVARFRNEARASAQLGHDNIARVFFSGEHDGVHYIAYEYAEGLTLKQVVEQRGVLTPEDTVNYAIQATLALNHMSSAGIIHRDIKPSNIILTTSGRIKVVDLGLARRDTSDSIGDLTVAGTTLGTFDYIAPEQARDPRAADIRSDIYSLGCSLYHMLTGQPPYPEGTALQKLLDHQGKSPPDPRLISRDVPDEVVGVVQKMMDTDPDQRYQDPGQLLADLMSLASAMGLRSVPAEGIVWRRIPVTRVRELSGALFVTGAVIAICLTALAMHFFQSPNDEDLNLAAKNALDFVGVRESLSPTSTAQTVPELPDALVSKTNDDPGNGAGSTNAVAVSSEKVPEPPGNTGIEVESPAVDSFVVNHLDGTQETAPSLQKAWDYVRNGDIIELDFDGELTLPTYRLGRLNSVDPQQITIRAAANRSPILRFEGDTRSTASNPGQLFYMTRNLKLVLSGIQFQVKVGEDVDAEEQWVLFECDGANRVNIRDCTFTVDNSHQRNVSVFRFNDQTSSIYPEQRTIVSLKNVVVRGGCDLVLVNDQAGGAVSMDNCGIAVDGSLIDSRGSDARVPQGDLILTMDHTTSILGKPAIRMRDSRFLDGGEADRTLPRLDVISRGCVFSSIVPGGTFVDVRGNAYRDDLQDHMTWRGTGNLYNGFSTFWLVESGSLDGDVQQYDFNEWIDKWQRMTLGQEESAGLMKDDVWLNSDSLRTADVLDHIPAKGFELNRRYFFDGDGAKARHAPDAEGRVIGADVSSLPSIVNTPTAVTPADQPSVAPATEET